MILAKLKRQYKNQSGFWICQGFDTYALENTEERKYFSLTSY